MKHPSPDDIADMKAKGFDPSTIQAAEEDSKLWHEAQRVIGEIRAAFAKVVLGEGIGLYEAQGLDGCVSESKLKQLRSKDEKRDWSRITAESLNECNSSLSFFDAEGMRFHLPAYLIADLCGEYHHGMSFSLCRPGDRFALLSAQQVAAVRQFLLYIAGEASYEFERPEILSALDEYWFDQHAAGSRSNKSLERTREG